MPSAVTKSVSGEQVVPDLIYGGTRFGYAVVMIVTRVNLIKGWRRSTCIGAMIELQVRSQILIR